MLKATKKSHNLEILISTMNRASLSFLNNMLPSISDPNINMLIVNQTNESSILVSNSNHIKVLNTLDKGLPQSRNLAIENASADICLIADDDIHYVSNFKEIILDAFEKYQEADIITFKMTNQDGQFFRDYRNIIKHDKNTINTVNSVVIAFKLESVKGNVHFNNNFGLGAQFQVGNEFVFLRNAINAGLKIFFEPKVILSHPNFSSGQDGASDRVIYGRSALYYKYYGLKAYAKIGIDLIITSMRGKLAPSKIISKFRVGLNGINDYKLLVMNGTEIR
ncbi:glycosyltransferase family A protein [Flavobacteriaceae bacterium]|jgi:hypothetical protein|nr:hypothetical protein [Flavobacteriaceae bacterium]MDC0957576.1 glycosyltransferase family A protein [Flavobacteriaceae bacterium]MDC1051814.1 glycosyltransferase family A protein [Flavobacteriaceae bacterium]